MISKFSRIFSISSLITIILLSMFSKTGLVFSTNKQEISEDAILNTFNLSNYFWLDADIASMESTLSGHYPDVAVGPDNNIHAVWDDTYGGYMIYYSMWDYETREWGDMELISVGGTSVAERPAIAVDSQNRIHVVWQDDTNYYGTFGTDLDICYATKVTDSDTWSTIELVSSESTGGSAIPDLAIDGDDNVHVCWYDNSDYLGSGTDLDIFYKVRYSASSSWGTTQVVSTESDDSSSLPQITVTNNGDIFIVWNDDTNFDGDADRDIFFKYKLAGGSWSSVEDLSWASDDYSSTPHITCEENGRLHVVWFDYFNMFNSGTDIDVFYTSYDPDIGSWGNIEVVSEQCLLSSTYPDVGVDPFGNVHVCWQDTSPYGGSGSDADVIYRVKDTNTNTWSDEILVTPDNDGNSNTPDMAIDSLGHVSIVWYDNTEYLGSGSDYDIFHRKLVSIPEKPILDSLSPNPSKPGNISLNWSESMGAARYLVYRDTKTITSTNLLTPIATIQETNYIDNLEIEGTYYYIIRAANNYANIHSNLESVVIQKSANLFTNINLGETLILAGILGGFQLLLTIIVILLFKTVKPKTKPSERKKN